MSLLRVCSRQLFWKRPAVEPLFTGCLRAASRAVNDKQPLKKAKTPKGRFDNLEETSKDVLETLQQADDLSKVYLTFPPVAAGIVEKSFNLELQFVLPIQKVRANPPTLRDQFKFPDDVNPVTKEKGGPRGPEPTRYGDWERKGRCVDF